MMHSCERISEFVRTFANDGSSGTAIKCGLIVAGLAVAIIAVVYMFGADVAAMLGQAPAETETVLNSGSGGGVNGQS